MIYTVQDSKGRKTGPFIPISTHQVLVLYWPSLGHMPRKAHDLQAITVAQEDGLGSLSHCLQEVAVKDNQPRPQGNVVLQRNSECCYHWKGEEMLVLQENASKLPMPCRPLTDCCPSPPSLFLPIPGPLTVVHMCPSVPHLLDFASAIFSAWKAWRATFYFSLQLQLKFLL